MPIDFDLDRPGLGLEIRAWGVLVDADLLGFLREFDGLPDRPTGLRALVDVRNAESVEISNDELRKMASDFRTGAIARLAFVTTSDLGFGLARMYQIRRQDDEMEIAVFRRLEEAEAWLG